ncbi:hypothetical protein MFM001_30140 [Mycobacterium sp. MFM001]|nr:hypothetical protein MFM001_30140 [Mycobacterium sp. MFM001]
MLAGGAALAALGITASACGSRQEKPPEVDPLQAQLTLARNDSEKAAAAATAESPRVAAALRQVASERSQHADALSAEIDRVAGITSSTSSSTTTTTSSAPPGPPPTLSDVVGSLRGSAASASQLAITESGYRAGLMGSIAAACTAAYTVALVFGDATT